MTHTSQIRQLPYAGVKELPLLLFYPPTYWIYWPSKKEIFVHPWTPLQCWWLGHRPFIHSFGTDRLLNQWHTFQHLIDQQMLQLWLLNKLQLVEYSPSLFSFNNVLYFNIQWGMVHCSLNKTGKTSSSASVELCGLRIEMHSWHHRLFFVVVVVVKSFNMASRYENVNPTD